jgi:RES domain-containing protein
LTAYRVVRRKYADLSGEGSRLSGGRFTPMGIEAIYTSESIALALLEVLVHVDKSEVPEDYVVMALEFDDSTVSWLPPTQMAKVDPDQFWAFHRKPVFRVASIIVPRENNYVLLPQVRGFAVSILWIEALEFDSRLLSTLK